MSISVGRRGDRLKGLQRRAFNSKRWRLLRWEIAERAEFRCELGYEGCEVYPGDSFEIDHIVPRRDHDDIEQFWDKGNLQFVCVACHKVKRFEENRLHRDSNRHIEVVAEIDKFSEYLRGMGS